MLIHRTISFYELYNLLDKGKVEGRCNYEKYKQLWTTFNKPGKYTAFYVDDFYWIGTNHVATVYLDIPEDQLQFGIGTYSTSKKCAETGIWYGQRGSELQKIKEAYIPEYKLSDVLGISYSSYYDNCPIAIECKNLIKEKNIPEWPDKEYQLVTNNFKKNLKIHYCPDQYKKIFYKLKEEYTGLIEFSKPDKYSSMREQKFYGSMNLIDKQNYEIRIHFEINMNNDNCCFYSIITNGCEHLLRVPFDFAMKNPEIRNELQDFNNTQNKYFYINELATMIRQQIELYKNKEYEEPLDLDAIKQKILMEKENTTDYELDL